jgi:hypothetical protein
MRIQFRPNGAHYFIAAVWMVNGLFCKVLDLVPRHEAIVSRILHTNNARPLTLLIGLAEIGMAMWIISGVYKRFNVLAQILVIATMNSLEFFLAPDLLLWGRANALFAFAFITLIYLNEKQASKKSINHAVCYPS